MTGSWEKHPSSPLDEGNPWAEEFRGEDSELLQSEFTGDERVVAQDEEAYPETVESGHPEPWVEVLPLANYELPYRHGGDM